MGFPSSAQGQDARSAAWVAPCWLALGTGRKHGLHCSAVQTLRGVFVALLRCDLHSLRWAWCIHSSGASWLPDSRTLYHPRKSSVILSQL